VEEPSGPRGAFRAAGKPVFAIEYAKSAGTRAKVEAAATAAGLPVLFTDRQLTGWAISARHTLRPPDIGRCSVLTVTLVPETRKGIDLHDLFIQHADDIRDWPGCRCFPVLFVPVDAEPANTPGKPMGPEFVLGVAIGIACCPTGATTSVFHTIGDGEFSDRRCCCCAVATRYSRKNRPSRNTVSVLSDLSTNRENVPVGNQQGLADGNRIPRHPVAQAKKFDRHPCVLAIGQAKRLSVRHTPSVRQRSGVEQQGVIHAPRASRKTLL
jgi:hypothetical protein